jgi:hypothetical protein
MVKRVLLSLVLLGGIAAAQDPNKGKPDPFGGISPIKIDEAIRKGVDYLKSQEAIHATDPYGAHASELVLWTYVHAGLRPGNPQFDALFKAMLDEPMKNTYRVSLQAMILEEVQRVKYQKQIFKCAQFLVDNQCKNGQWAYGEPTTYPDPPADEVASDGGVRNFGAPETTEKPKVVRKIAVKKQKDGPETGDNSNSQYAALGLRACFDAGITLPKEVATRARMWWRESIHDEDAGKDPKAVATGPNAAIGGPGGWCYGGKAHGHKPYGSMTAGAVGSLAICGYLLGEKNPRREIAVLRGLEWLGREFTVAGNPGPSEHIQDVGWMQCYFLYALERAGLLCGVETMGTHKWYPEGATLLLGSQKPDGSWLSPVPHPDRSRELNSVWDTCFAILFLKRATRPLQDVASTDKYHPPK